MSRGPALQLLNEVLADMTDPGFAGQIALLVACLGLASWFARWWGRQHGEGGRLQQAGARLTFPLAALLLIGLALFVGGYFMHVNLLRLALPLLASMALVRMLVFVLRQAFPRAAWLTAWERIIAACVWSVLALHISGVLPVVIDGLEEVRFAIGHQQVSLWMLIHGLLTVGLTVIAALWLAGVLETRLMGAAAIDANLRLVFVRLAKAILTVLALLFSLSLVGIDMTALSVFTGALGVGLGMGLQRIASNYVSGFIILLDRSIRPGNVVQAGGEAGVVTEITTRYTVLRHGNGSESLVPNESLVNGVVQNHSFSDSRVRLTASVSVAYGCDVELAMRLMAEIAAAVPRVLAEPAPRAFLVRFADSGIDLDLHLWIADPQGGTIGVLSEVNLGIWRGFREAGIEIPYPQREVRLLPSATID